MNFKNLQYALQFVSGCQQDIGNPYQCHCIVSDSKVKATNGVFSMEIPILEHNTPEFYPHTLKLLEALTICDGEVTKFSINKNSIELISGSMKFKVPALTLKDAIPSFEVDKKVGSVDRRIQTAIDKVLPITNETAQDVIPASVHFSSACVTASNTRIAVQHYHQIDMPEVLLPVRYCAQVRSHSSDLVGFGFSENSFTFYFKDGGKFMTSMFDVKEWRNLNDKLPTNIETKPLNDDIREGFKKISGFADRYCTISNDEISAESSSTSTSASCEIINGPDVKRKYSVQDLSLMMRYAERVNFEDERFTYFFGENTRGLIANMRVE